MGIFKDSKIYFRLEKDENKNEEQECLQENNEEGKMKKAGGLTVFTATFFLVGDVAGCGLLSFPWALSRIGYVGILLIFLFGVGAIYSATLLGRCWMMISERFAEYHDQPVRHPYPLIGQLAFGKTFRKLVSFCVIFTSCGSSVAYLLLISENLMALLPSANISYGCWLVIVAAVLCPVCWLGTPKDFWPVALFASLTTSIACVFIIIQIARDAPIVPPAFHAPLEFKTFLMAFGILCFGFGGHQVFPTIQVDMKKPEKFGTVAAFGFCTVLCMYVPVAIAGFLVYGSSLEENVLMSLLPGPVQLTAVVLLNLHLLGGFVILLSPVSLEMEDFFNVPNCFCFRRVLMRTILVCILLFVALSLPQFGAILALIGGSTMTCIVFIIPATCYLKLSSMKGDWETIEIPLHEKVLCIEIIVVGTLAGIAATYSALDALTYSHFSKPLYLS
ncbi:proton-coupled amino acid transporter 4 [Elysia marginata]|uniref:Proton-coupled amino acid transporter 4 n=1 Tax=Elysia marginata TaxID=1093978 RepID=A0AAV4IU73_9GAST|nr:proton-coupled amino acid transporter 4 [Elysia marginata]